VEQERKAGHHISFLMEARDIQLMEGVEALAAMSLHEFLYNSNKSSSVLMSVAMEPAHQAAKETAAEMAVMVAPRQRSRGCVMEQRLQLVVVVVVAAEQIPI